MVMGLLGLLEVLITCAGGGRGRHVCLRGNGIGGIKGGDQPDPSLDLGPCTRVSAGGRRRRRISSPTPPAGCVARGASRRASS
jgi:hypothetical protein